MRPGQCWRCGRTVTLFDARGLVTSTRPHAEWCSMPGGCSHCGWSPCRWWCLGEAWGDWSGQRNPNSATQRARRAGRAA